MTHRIRWYGVAKDHEGNRVLIPRNTTMRGRDWGWEAKCTCGWETHTGGAIEASIKQEIFEHRLFA